MGAPYVVLLSQDHKYDGILIKNESSDLLADRIEALSRYFLEDRTEHQMGLRHQLENLKVLCRLCD